MPQIPIDKVISNFLRERRARSSAPGTIKFYRSRLNLFEAWCKANNIDNLEAVSADELRSFILSLEGHTPGGVHAIFKSVHALYYWYEEEYEPAGWKNPIRKLHAPKVPEELLEPADPGDIDELLRVCEDDLIGLRDRAIILFLQDTGVRANELLSLSIDDVDLIERQAFIRVAKGGKPRPVFFDKRTKRALKAYLAVRPDVKEPRFFLNNYRDKLQYDGLRAMVIRRAQQAGIAPPTLHSFRRGFALNAIRRKVDLLTLMRLLGHHSTQVLQRYVKLTSEDLRAGHDQALSPE